MRGSRIVIPRSLQKEMLDKIHVLQDIRALLNEGTG